MNFLFKFYHNWKRRQLKQRLVKALEADRQMKNAPLIIRAQTLQKN